MVVKGYNLCPALVLVSHGLVDRMYTSAIIQKPDAQLLQAILLSVSLVVIREKGPP